MAKLKALSDNDLLILLRNDNKQAFTEIYDRHWEMLYAIAYNRLRDIQNAEDVVHDVFSSLWANRNKSEINNLTAYLGTAVKFRILAGLRREAVKRNHENSLINSNTVESYDISDVLHHKHLLVAVQAEVENLPERCRLVFKYSREQHLPIKEIAVRLDLSTSTVENHLNKALKRLSSVIKKLGTVLTF